MDISGLYWDYLGFRSHGGSKNDMADRDARAPELYGMTWGFWRYWVL